MKVLKKICLVNWYHIIHETLDIRGSALFMGDNGSGKSTILDAIQFALVADLSQIRFNHAANENADRSLQSYTRWMTGTSGPKESHVFNRGDCTSYVLLEFEEPDDGSGSRSFVIGAVIDSYRDGRDPNRLHFIQNDATLKDVPVFEEGKRIPLTTQSFSKLMRGRTGFYYAREPGPYRDALLIRLGKLSPDFTKILVKALAFKPLGKVQEFVTNFLLDPRPLDTRSLQENLGHFKSLLQKAKDAELRVENLERIRDVLSDYERAEREMRQVRFVELRARAGIYEVLVENHQVAIINKKAALATEEQRHQELKQNENQIEQEFKSVVRALSDHQGFAERERAKDDLHRAESELASIQQLLQKLSHQAQRLHEIRREVQQIPNSGFFNPNLPFTDLHFEARTKMENAKRQLQETRERGDAAHARLKDLKKGIRPIPPAARLLKSLLQEELHCKAHFLCELVEVSEERWQDAVEGYLNTRRFDIILDPKHFLSALSLYESHKKRLGLHGVGLVDAERTHLAKPVRGADSLANRVDTQNKHARAYVDFIMGELICCDSEMELRKYSRSITPTCMVYQNHAARQTPFDVYGTWFIGTRGQARLVEQAEAEIELLARDYRALAESQESLKILLARTTEGEGLERAIGETEQWHERAGLVGIEIARLKEHLRVLHDPAVEALEQRSQELRAQQSLARDQTLQNAQLIGALLTEINSLTAGLTQELIQVEVERSALETEFSGLSQTDRESFENTYVEQLAKPRAPNEILRNYEPQRKGRETKVMNLLSELNRLRSEYNNRFGFAAPTVGEDLSPYLRELATWQESFLPEYRLKIEHAKDLSLQQLMEDVVHKLRENLDLVEDQFKQINRALEGFQFGHDRYQFVYKIKPEFESFERLIREAAQYENQPLFETDWRARFKLGGGLDALFNNLISGSTAQVENELAQYSDYREYYEYDLKITDLSGKISHFSKVNKWKSGGETQTPYYIAMIASLYRLYRLQPSQPGGARGTIGLVLLDEAFNKMDEDHLKSTLEFTRRLGLQLIMATPKERADFIIPHVQSTWLVAKDPISGQAFLQDFHQQLSGEVG